MSYQEARRIKNTGLKDLIAQNIVSGQGVGSAIGSSISQSFRAKMTGIKERFDPLNIAKKLTGNLGAAILGRMTGRSQKDISYFAGGRRGNSSAGITQDTDMENMGRALYTNVSEGQGQRMRKGDSVTNVLAKLYNLMKKSYEAEEKRRERTIKDKINEEDEKILRHKELLEAITGMKYTGKASNLAKKEEGIGFFDLIMAKIMAKIDALWSTITDILGKLNLMPLASTALNLAKTVAPAVIGALEMGAGALAAVPGAVAALFLTPWVASAEERKKIEANPNAPEYKNNPYAMKVRGEVKTEEEGAAKNIKKGLKQYRRQEIADVVDSKIADSVIKEEYGSSRGELKKWLDEHPAPISMYQAPSERAPNTLQRLGVEASTAEAGQGSATAARMDPRRTDLVTPDAGVTTAGGAYVGGMHGAKQVPDSMSSSTITPSASIETPTTKSSSATTSTTSMTPATPSASMAPPMPNPIGEQVQKSITQNNNLLLQEPAPKLITIDNSKSVKMSGGGQGSGIIKDGTVDVRIDDPTLQKLQKQNYRPI